MKIVQMLNGIVSCPKCTSCFATIVIISAIGLTSIVVGLVGLGFYIPTVINYNAYTASICSVLDHAYENCEHGHVITANTCYSVMWSVVYMLSTSAPDHFVYSTITQIYEKSTDALNKLSDYPDFSNHTCYYNNINTANVQWEPPTSARPFLIMMIVGFSLAVVYFIVLGSITVYRCRTRKN